MWGILGGIIGFIGGVVVAHVSALLQRKNWQLQEAMKAYAQLFTQGNDALRKWNTLHLFLDNLNHAVDPQTITKAAKSDAALGMEHDRLLRLRDDLERDEDRTFRHLLNQCWMLERNPELQEAIESLRKAYGESRVTVRMLFGRLVDIRKDQIDKTLQDRVVPESLFGQMEELRHRVAEMHFHDRKRLPASSGVD